MFKRIILCVFVFASFLPQLLLSQHLTVYAGGGMAGLSSPKAFSQYLSKPTVDYMRMGYVVDRNSFKTEMDNILAVGVRYCLKPQIRISAEFNYASLATNGDGFALFRGLENIFGKPSHFTIHSKLLSLQVGPDYVFRSGTLQLFVSLKADYTFLQNDIFEADVLSEPQKSEPDTLRYHDYDRYGLQISGGIEWKVLERLGVFLLVGYDNLNLFYKREEEKALTFWSVRAGLSVVLF